MKITDYQFNLPDELIADVPTETRSASRLLCVNKNNGALQDKTFTDLLDILGPGDLLVFNDTKVIPARLFGNKDTGGSVEVMLERVLDEHTALAHVRSSKSPKPGRKLKLEGCVDVEVVGREGDLFKLRFEGEQSVIELLNAHGRIPLPPYIEREATNEDIERYQTIYARAPGAVAAPTAGLHFDEKMMESLRNKGVETSFVTLHVGAGTFQPIRVENIEAHQMHSELIELSQETVDKISSTKAKGGRVVAVGTTVVRVLESVAAQLGELQAFRGETKIFIYPGFRFKVVDSLVTNFHLPGSTLLLLVSAFASKQIILNAYQHAIDQEYRFYSYGDAMYIGEGIV